MLTKATQKLVLIMDKHGSAIRKSVFHETGKLTPEEFVIAGDFLVENFPSWSWCSGLPDKRRPHLPPEKQFLQTKNVPCFTGHGTHDNIVEKIVEDLGEEGSSWIEAHVSDETADAPVEELKAVDLAAAPVPAVAAASAAAAAAAAVVEDDADDDDDGDVADLDEFVYAGAAVKDDDKAAVAAAPAAQSGVASTRSYDITITYDVHYSTPRVWLFGYDRNNNPLKELEWRQDFSADHVDKTVTVEVHPHLGYSCPSIHPCKHASAMVRMVSMLGGSPLDVKYYMLIFLKFIQAMIPNIEYDYTSQFQVADG